MISELQLSKVTQLVSYFIPLTKFVSLYRDDWCLENCLEYRVHIAYPHCALCEYRTDLIRWSGDILIPFTLAYIWDTFGDKSRLYKVNDADICNIMVMKNLKEDFSFRIEKFPKNETWIYCTLAEVPGWWPIPIYRVSHIIA